MTGTATRNGRLTWADGDRTLLRCPCCSPSQAAKVERRGDRLAITCFGGCPEAEVIESIDVAKVLSELAPAPRASQSHHMGREQAAALPSSWSPVDLIPVIENGATEEPPTMVARQDGPCLLYAGKNHALFGEPESCKGWAGLHAAGERLAAGEPVLYFDFEDTAATVVGRLLALGVEPQAIGEHFHYVRPDEALDDAGQAALEELLSLGPTLAVIDGLTEALTLHGLELKDNATSLAG